MIAVTSPRSTLFCHHLYYHLIFCFYSNFFPWQGPVIAHSSPSFQERVVGSDMDQYLV